MSYLIVDLETVAIDDVATYLTEPIEAPSNWKDPEKIAAYVKDAKKKQVEKAGLDVDLGRIVALGVIHIGDEEGQPQVLICKDQTQEMTWLGTFWSQYFASPNTMDWPTLVTFNGMGFDLPMLLRRSLYLGVRAPKIQIDRFKHPHVIDLMTLLSLDGRLTWRGLQFYANRFGLGVQPDITGAEIAECVAKGDWEAVERHCTLDLQTTLALAKRMGIL